MFFGAILTSGFSAGWSIVKLILITVLVLVLAFYSTRLIAKYQNYAWSAKNNIQFIESYRVGGNKMVAIAKIGEKYFALGIGKEEIHVIAELKKDDLKLPDQMVDATVEKTPKMSFKEVLANMKGNAKDDNEMKFSKLRKFLVLFLIPLAFVVIFSGTGAVHATTVTPDTGAEEGQVDSVTSDNNDATTLGLSLSTNSDETSLSGTLQILLIITVISLAPSILVMVTSFTRIIIVLHFVRTAIGTQSSPPNNVLIGLSLFLTLFIMSPVIAQIKTEAYDPLVAEEITQQEALERGIQPLREFMLKQTRQDDLRLFMDIAKIEPVESVDELSITIIIPAFIISELRAAFIIGFLIYVPFIVIDMVVSSVLMSMGMMMLPPTTISMPFKILLFILADGWNLVIGQLVNSFNF